MCRVTCNRLAAPPNPRNVLFLSRLMMPWRCAMCGVICLPCLPALPALPAAAGVPRPWPGGAALDAVSGPGPPFAPAAPALLPQPGCPQGCGSPALPALPALPAAVRARQHAPKLDL